MALARKLEAEEHAIAIGDVDPQADARRVERAKPVADHIAMFKGFLQSKQTSADHIAYTIRDVELCFSHAGVTSAAALTFNHVDTWRAFLITTGYEGSTDSNRTANRRTGSVRAFLRYLVQRVHALDRCVLEGYKKLPTKGHERSKRRALTAAEIELLITKCPDESRREIYRFVLNTGLRQGEVRGMTVNCFDFEKMHIHISAKLAKSKVDQWVPIHPDYLPTLKKLVAGKLPAARVFHLGRENDVVPNLHKDCEAAGVDTTDVDFHGLRHTFCTQLARAGVRAEVLHKLARHKDAQTTLNYYLHTTPDETVKGLSLLKVA